MNLWSVIRVFHGFETDWKRTRDLTGSLGRISLMSKSSGRVMREIVLEATMGFVGLFFSFSSFWFGFVEGNRRALVKRTKSKQEKRKKNNQAKKEGISIIIYYYYISKINVCFACLCFWSSKRESGDE